jgi:alpha-glucosidase
MTVQRIIARRPCAALLLLWLGMGTGIAQAAAAPGLLELSSPDGHVLLQIQTHGQLSYRLLVNGVRVLNDSRLGLRLRDGTQLGRAVALLQAQRSAVDTSWDNPFGKQRLVRDQHRELKLMLSESDAGGRRFNVVFRAFDDGVGFRYELLPTAGARDFILDEELTEFAFSVDNHAFAGDNVHVPPTRYDSPLGYRGSQEWEYRPQRLSDLSVDTVTGLPVLVHTPACWVAIMEADLYDWAGMWLAREPLQPDTTTVTLRARLSPRVDGDGLVKSTLPHLSPWRVLMIGSEPARLAESNLLLNFATPSQLADVSWVKPGLSAWDPWFSNVVTKTTASMESFIQLASDMGWPYQIVDGGWYVNRETDAADITRSVPAIDLDAVRAYAADRNVKLWLWLYWTDAARFDNYKKAFDQYEKWGIAGVKIDFMDRNDQDMVNWYEAITRYAAQRHLMVDFHGAYWPTGMNRTWPNQITREGVMGNEYNKWSSRVTAEHRVTLPFTRFLAGPGDFTPGSFVNRTAAQFQTLTSPTQVQGTRANELALFVVYDSPFMVVADYPDNLRGKAGIDFLQGGIPTVWDETRVLSGAVGEYIVTLRRSGQQWYLGALTNGYERVKTVPLSFLGPGRWKLRWWHDALSSALHAEDLEVEDRVVSASDTLDIHMQPGGGAVMHFVPAL